MTGMDFIPSPENYTLSDRIRKNKTIQVILVSISVQNQYFVVVFYIL